MMLKGVRQKLGLLVVGLVILVIISSALSYYFVNRIEKDVLKLGLVEEPLEEAVLELEINVGEGARAVILYSIASDAKHIQRFQDSDQDFLRSMEEFIRLAETDAEMNAIIQVAELHGEFQSLGARIIDLTDLQEPEIAELRKNIVEIDEIIDQELQPLVDRTASGSLQKLEAALEIEINVDEAFAAIQSYIALPEFELRKIVSDSAADFEKFEVVYRSFPLSTTELKWIDIIDEDFQAAVLLGNSVMRRSDEIRVLVEQLEANLEKIDYVVDEEVHPIIHAESVKALDNAAASFSLASLMAIILASSGFAVGIGALILVRRQIINPIKRLNDAALSLRDGDLSARISTISNDEFGNLATSFNQMADSLQQGQKELNSAQEELVRTEKLAILGQFTGGMAHDLRNPLGAIKNAHYMIQKRLTADGATDANPKLKVYLDIIDQQVDRSNKYITDMMTFADVVDPVLAETRLDEVVRETLETMSKNDNITLMPRLDPDLHPVLADGEQLQRVFLNLANNAQDAMPDGGQLAITAKNVNNHVEIKFTDTGEGISDEIIGNIFDPLFTTKTKGTGLGLAVCQEIILRHGGTISVRRNEEPSGGTTFEVTLPATGAHRQAQGEPANER